MAVVLSHSYTYTHIHTHIHTHTIVSIATYSVKMKLVSNFILLQTISMIKKRSEVSYLSKLKGKVTKDWKMWIL